MKVLLIDKNLVEPIHRTKWQLLAEQPGIELHAVAPTTWQENYRRITCRPDPGDGFEITPLPVTWPGYENRAFYRHGLARMARRHRPDAVIAFEEPFSLFAWQALAAAGHRRPPVPLALYTWDNRTDGRCYPYRPSFAYRWIERRVMASARQVWCANSEARDRFERDYPGKPRLLPFGLDLDRFAAVPRIPGGDGSFQVGYVGRLLPMKGIDTLLDAVASLPATVRLTLLGAGPDRERLVTRSRAPGLDGRVRFLDAVPSERVVEQMAGLDLLVLPSRTTGAWKEQFGKVLVEAMALGVPVVGSSSGAIPEILAHPGWTFPEGDAAALAARIDAVRRDPAERERRSAEGRARATTYSAEAFAKSVRRLLEEMCHP